MPRPRASSSFPPLQLPPPQQQQRHPGDCACCLVAPSSLQQTLSELDHSRSAAAAAAAGDLAKLRRMIKKDPLAATAPPRGSTDGFTALHHAARSGNLAAVRMLLDAGADPNAETAAGRATPLHRSAFAGHLAVSKILLRAGAEARRSDGDGETPAFKAASQVRKKGRFSLLVSSSELSICRG